MGMLNLYLEKDTKHSNYKSPPLHIHIAYNSLFENSNMQSTFDIVYFSHYKHFPWDTCARNMDTGGRACLGAQPDGPWASLTARPSPPAPPQAHPHLGAWVHLDPRPTPARELMSPPGSFPSPEKGFSISHEPRERPEQKVRL